VKQSPQPPKVSVTELSNGWKLVKKQRFGSNHCDTYYYSPGGKKFRSVSEIQRWSQEMNISIDLQAFYSPVHNKRVRDDETLTKKSNTSGLEESEIQEVYQDADMKEDSAKKIKLAASDWLQKPGLKPSHGSKQTKLAAFFAPASK